MTPISTRPDVAPRTSRGAGRSDFSTRLKGQLRALRARLERRDALIEAIRGVNEVPDPSKVAAWLVRQAGAWVPAPCWAVVAHNTSGQLAVLADQGLTSNLGPALWSAANWVLRNGTEFMSADLTRDIRASDGAIGTAMAFPLICRDHTVGVLVALDPMPSMAVPTLGATLARAVRTWLEPGAIALDNSLALQKAEELSITDDLTQLYNARYLNLVLRREAKRVSRSGRPLSVLFLDLDGFKTVNDTHGHLAGSQALVEAAAVMRSCARETDVVARFGGDEFCLVLPETGRDGAVSVAERIRERLRSFQFLAQAGLSVHLTASIGIATLPDVAGSAEELLRAADQAMYRVKGSGKDGISIAE